MNSNLADFNQQERDELARFLESENAKARLQQSIHTFTDMCWDKCVTGKMGNKLGSGEESCLSNCVERFLDTSIFIVKRLEESRASLGGH
jgi:import inner membrane translocase subunit TIM8